MTATERVSGDGGEGENQFSRRRPATIAPQIGDHFSSTAAAAPMSVVVIVLFFFSSLLIAGLLNRAAIASRYTRLRSVRPRYACRHLPPSSASNISSTTDGIFVLVFRTFFPSKLAVMMKITAVK